MTVSRNDGPDVVVPIDAVQVLELVDAAWGKSGLLTEAEADAQNHALPPGITEEMVDAAYEALGRRVDKLSIKRALFAVEGVR